MGCLSVYKKLLNTKLSCLVVLIYSFLHITVVCKNALLKIKAECLNAINVICYPKNKPVYIDYSNKNVTLQLSVALVCQVSLDIYEYFYVKEGPLLVEEGYFRVRKQKINSVNP
jgi:hypothetical protein